MKIITGGSIVFVAALAVSFSSCQKEADGSYDPVADDTTYLAKEIVLDTTRPVGLDTAFLASFYYDGSKRVSGYDFMELAGGTTRYTEYKKFHYTALSDTLPSMVSSNFNYTADTKNTYLFYLNGFVIKDSTVDYTGTTVNNIAVRLFKSIGNNKYVMEQYGYFPVPGGSSYITDSVVYTHTLSNGNIVAMLQNSYLPGSGTLHETTQIQQTFDTKNGAYKRFRGWYLGYYENLIYESGGLGLNNPITYTYAYTSTSSGSLNENETIVYEYNAADYPVIMRITGNNDANKAILSYIRL